MVVLDQGGVRQRHAMVHSTAAAHRVLLQGAQPGRVLRVSRIWRRSPPPRRPTGGSGSRHRTGGRAGSARCARRSAGHEPGRARWRSPRRGPPRAVNRSELHPHPTLSDAVEHPCRDGKPGDHPGGPRHQVRATHEGPRDRGERGDVAAAPMSSTSARETTSSTSHGESLADSTIARTEGSADLMAALHRSWIRSGTTSVTNRCRTIPPGSRRTSKCPAHRTSSRFGKSSRQCAPRVSSRARAAAAARLPR